MLPFDTRDGNREGSRLKVATQLSVVEVSELSLSVVKVSGPVDCPLVRSVFTLQRLGWAGHVLFVVDRYLQPRRA